MSNVTNIEDHRRAARDARQMPASIETEQALLGAVLINNEAFGLVYGLVRAEDFSDVVHQRLWGSLSGLIMRGVVATPQTLLPFLGEAEIGEGVTAAQYVARLVAEASSIRNAPDYARLVADLSTRRRLISAGMTMVDRAYDAPVDLTADDLIRDAQDALESAKPPGAADKGAMRGMTASIVDKVLAAALEMSQGDGSHIVSSGLPDLDQRLPMRGLASGSLTVLAGRPGMGKTMVAASLASAAGRKGHGVAVFSLEVPASEIVARMACSWMGSSAPHYGDVLSGRMPPHEFDMFAAAARDVAQWPIYIDDSASLSIAEIGILAERQARRMAAKGTPLRLVVIDHAQFVRGIRKEGGNRTQEVGDIAKHAKVIAKRLDCNVVLCSQLNRGVEGRDDKRPNMSDLRDSGEIEEAADCVLLLYREAYYLQKEALKSNDASASERLEAVRNDLTIDVAKARQGGTGPVHLWCDVARSIIQCRGR
jgi:replicative DNA helicase